MEQKKTTFHEEQQTLGSIGKCVSCPLNRAKDSRVKKVKSHLNDCEILVVLITITRSNRSVHGSGGPREGAKGARLPPYF